LLFLWFSFCFPFKIFVSTNIYIRRFWFVQEKIKKIWEAALVSAEERRGKQKPKDSPPTFFWGRENRDYVNFPKTVFKDLKQFKKTS
jgi:hypothetical protein